ncbi:glycogen debranching enzyme family protein [Faecalicatena contorta]|uniref:amylo-alpha-1,6-glucosidase n=1 Tax=Faecalicatena contorta TaxID=39482 RepID=UPI00195FB048|nr:amylo-alpha-1,6-glucosidase [Faecalicatena contorta]MBM6684509.1 glycogen debranching enzyme family protein [Faecalicatena contorta]MBM6709178.1 glycogen debranching enzyme family protein [Faecalicatena contorta]
MKWIYGRQDFKTVERSEEACYLMTNGLGGFSSLTAAGAAARNDHAFFMACVRSPNSRYNIIHRLREQVGDRVLSAQEMADGSGEAGYRYLSSFTWEDTPVWQFQVDGVEIRKEAAMEQGENTIALRYEIANRSREARTFLVTPFYQFTPKGEDLDPGREPAFVDGKIAGEAGTLVYRTNGHDRQIRPEKETYYYRYDACDGRRECGSAVALHQMGMTVPPGEERVLEVVWHLEAPGETFVFPGAREVIERAKQFRQELSRKAGFQDEMADVLVKSAAQFVSERASTGGKTILAGFPFFEDWGRDTMIALPGVCLSTGQYDTAKDILRTFAAYEKDGLMPNLFPEGENEPLYNTVDAALLFINCVWLYYEKTEDGDFVREMYPVMERIIEAYRTGTEYGIHMDGDGLIMAGQGLDQVTWMDVRIGDILPTPRHGKPVEINAYWYNALRIMEHLAPLPGKEPGEYDGLAEQVKRSFTEKFWMEEKGCLKDLVSGTGADGQIRCNQIWAVSFPFTMLDEEKERKVVETVFEKLWTPCGLRTLEKDDPQFHPSYGGEMRERDMAYHQGTVWPFPLGAYYLAYLKVHGYSRAAKEKVKEQMEGLESALREGCAGQLPEIYDGAFPTVSRGCFAQAWSVGELLRVYEKLEK